MESQNEEQIASKMIGQGYEVRGRLAIFTSRSMAVLHSIKAGWNEPLKAGCIVLIVDALQNGQCEVIYEEEKYKVSAKSLRLIKIENILQGTGIAITGELSLPREYYKTLIEAKGGKFKNQVTRNCDYLVCNRPSQARETTKLIKARELGKSVITENQFFKLLRV